MTVRVQEADFDTQAEINAITDGTDEIGGVASFIGTVRKTHDGEMIKAMTLEHYPGMTEQALETLKAQAQDRWPLYGVTIIHRYGRLLPGANIVLVITASQHRQAAFDACQFIMDYLKTDAPFWKAEELADGTTRWVEPRTRDTAAKQRWST
ncbi:MAG: molybdenum cofactor biosynthesis protein MoaE [Pseudomonadota bacterium]